VSGDVTGSRTAAGRARELVDRKLAAAPRDEPDWALARGCVVYLSGEPDAAQRILDDALADAHSVPDPLHAAGLASLLGHGDLAVQLVRDALEAGRGDPYLPRVHPLLHAVHGRPDFEALFD
jgi:hypothetical protein